MTAKQPTPRTLEGQAVKLEPLSLDHAPDLFAAAGGDDEVWRWLLVDTPRTPEQMRLLVEKALAEQRAGRRLPFAVVLSRTGKAIGSTSYLDFVAIDESLEIAWTWYGRSHWRTSVNTETMLLQLTFAFENLGIGRVHWTSDILNARSRAAIERVGGIQEGILRRHHRRTDGTWRDSVCFSMLATEWPSAKRFLTQRLADR